jgi:dephospho-CoA kinase
MKAPLHIGITGGIGAGKSLVSRIFKCLGVRVYDADVQARKLMSTDRLLIDRIKKEFGEQSYDADGSLNREFLRQTVFGSGAKEKVEKLNRIVHPRVGHDFEQWAHEHHHEPYLLKEAALLFEAGTSQRLDKIIVVACPESLRIKRILKRDPYRSEADVHHILKNQMSEEERIERADFVIMNDESRLIIPLVLELHEGFVRGT